MAVLSFTLSEEGVSAFRDALICLNKFSDDVSLEARKDSVRDPCCSNAFVDKVPSKLLTSAFFIVRPDNLEQLQVGLCELQIRHNQILLQIPIYAHRPISR